MIPFFFWKLTVCVVVTESRHGEGRLPVFALAVLCISASGMAAQACAPMAARALAGHTIQTSSRD